MSEAVADSSALLALLQEESGWQLVESYLPGLTVSAVNLGEVIGKLADSGMPESSIREALGQLSLRIAPFDEEQAFQVGLLRPATRPLGLSLGDRACLALGRLLELPVLTADKSWTKLDIAAVRCIR